MGETRTLAKFVHDLTFESLSNELVEKTKVIMIDTLSCVVAGNVIANEECDIIRKFAEDHGGDGATIWFTDGKKSGTMVAALANSLMAHTIDFDDTHMDSVSHFGAALTGTVLTLGQHLGASGKDIITAFVAGFEVAARVGNSVNKDGRSHYKYWHPTATASAVGAAAAAAKLYKLNEAEIEMAISLGADQASGFRYCVDKGDYSKGLHPGWASLRGIMAAKLTKLGAEGPIGLLEYPTGFCQAMSEKPNLEYLTAGLGTEFETLSDAIKLFPTIHCSHTSIESALDIVNEHDIDYRDIEKIYIEVTELAKGQGMNFEPDGVLAARLSVPCCVSIALRKKQLTLTDFTTEDIFSDENQNLMKRIEIQPNDQFLIDYPTGMVGHMTITMKDGTEYFAGHEYPKGHPLRPAEEEDYYNKFISLVTLRWDQAKSEKMYNAFNQLETYETVDDLISLLK
ncbi:MAG TPA: MmgE/PrpD family protein [Clostridiaceae bacterium]|nr:MmgE/PrpD family protein [Clostridiaceae bacterium]